MLHSAGREKVLVFQVDVPIVIFYDIEYMLFIYSVYEHLLGEKEIQATLKDEVEPKSYTLRIVTQARRFIGLPFGGGLVKLSRLYDTHGQLISPRKYSASLKSQIKEFKKECPIPYFKLWKGFVYVLVALGVGSLIFGINNKITSSHRENQAAFTQHQLSAIAAGQRYGVTFFTDVQGNNIDGLPEGWIKIVKVEGDTVFAQRGKKTVPLKSVFDIDHIRPILPASDSDWEETVERFDYQLLKAEVAKSSTRGSFDLLYVAPDKEKYSGVVLSIKGALNN
ncbi:hypothetical protein GCM10023231_13130 [Olivibacter ginsenosidimutans]|uniref:Uncharacterized protein n=1 Tax=Olivibacter ginsenosidimutans TaxID=1176537 RepID=A0ABP9AXM1_9SPHI